MGHRDIIECLVSVTGVDLNAAVKDGMTALHYAAREGHRSVAECLVLAPGIDVNTTTNHGMTALHFAAAGL